MNDSVFLVVNNCVLLLSLIDLSNDFQIEESVEKPFLCISAVSSASISWLASAQVAVASEGISGNAVYEIGELFELGIQLTYLLLLLALLGVGSFFVIRQVLVRRELDISAKELQVSTFFFFSFFFWFVLFYNINSFVV